MVQIPPSIRIGASVSIEMQTQDGAREYKSRIEDIVNGMLLVSLPTEKGQPVLFPVGQFVTLAVATVTGANLFVESEVMGRKSQPIPVFVARPMSIESNQQRLFHRVNVRIDPNQLWQYLGQGEPPAVTRPNGEDGLWRQFTGTILDVSGGGVGVLADSEVPRGAWVQVNFPLPITGDILNTCGRVMMSRPRPQGADTLYQLGVKFERLTNLDQERIVKANHQFQLEERRKARGL